LRIKNEIMGNRWIGEMWGRGGGCKEMEGGLRKGWCRQKRLGRREGEGEKIGKRRR